MLLTRAPVAVGVLPSVPRSMTVAVEAFPAFVVSSPVQPVVLPVLTATLFAMPAIEKVSVGSTDARTWTDSMVPIFIREVSKSVLLVTSRVVMFIVHVSAVPAAAVFVGLMMVGIWVLHAAPVAEEQPKRIVTVVLAAIVVVPVKAIWIVGEVPAVGLVYVPVKVLAPEVPFIFTFVSESPLNWKVLADGEAVLFESLAKRVGNAMVIVPSVGTALIVRNEMVCMALTGTTTGSPL